MTAKATVQLHGTSNLAESLLCSSPWHKQWHHPSLFVLDDSVNASMNSLGKGIIGLSLISLPGVPNNRSSIHDAEHEKQVISHRDVTISGQPALCSYISGIRNIMGPCLSPDCFFILVIFIPCFIRMKSLPSESSSLRTMRISDRNSTEIHQKGGAATVVYRCMCVKSSTSNTRFQELFHLVFVLATCL